MSYGECKYNLLNHKDCTECTFKPRTSPIMDYKALLIKYMSHVIDEESVCYLEGLTLDNFDRYLLLAGSPYHCPNDATRNDVIELITIRDEILAKRKAEYKIWRQQVECRDKGCSELQHHTKCSKWELPY